MAFSKELLRGFAAEMVRLGISLFGEKPESSHAGFDLEQLADKSAYWESEATSCRLDLKGFFSLRGFVGDVPQSAALDLGCACSGADSWSLPWIHSRVLDSSRLWATGPGSCGGTIPQGWVQTGPLW